MSSAVYADTFLQAIVEAPDDDAPRLIYADWLEDQGGDAGAGRAEFIRLQCARARLPAWDPTARELAWRERALLAEHERAWVGPVRDLARRWSFRRGFVEEVTLSAGVLLRRGAELFRLAPVRHVHL